MPIGFEFEDFKKRLCLEIKKHILDSVADKGPEDSAEAAGLSDPGWVESYSDVIDSWGDASMYTPVGEGDHFTATESAESMESVPKAEAKPIPGEVPAWVLKDIITRRMEECYGPEVPREAP